MEPSKNQSVTWLAATWVTYLVSSIFFVVTVPSNNVLMVLNYGNFTHLPKHSHSNCGVLMLNLNCPVPIVMPPAIQ